MIATKKAHPTVVGIGEILWDVFPDGPRFGGAPANFACSVAGLLRGEGRVAMVSGVGEDELGSRAMTSLEDHGVDTSALNRNDHPTGHVLVSLDPQGRARYEFAADTAWDNLRWTQNLQQLAAEADAVCFGTLGQRSERSRGVIRRFVSATGAECLRVLDVNLRDPFWSEEMLRQSLSLANVLKCNEDELPILGKLLGIEGDEQALVEKIAEHHSLRMTVLTQGDQGSLLYDGQRNWSHQQAVQTTVVDTVGAGDSFTATIVLGMLQHLSIGDMHAWANRVAAFVCSKPGATPTLPESLQRPSPISDH